MLPQPSIAYAGKEDGLIAAQIQSGKWRIGRKRFVKAKMLPKWKWHILYGGQPRKSDNLVE